MNMDSRMRIALDRYITGNFGEDQTSEEIPSDDPYFTEGVTARESNRPISANPYRAGTYAYDAWSFGWCDADMSLHVSAEDDCE